MMLRRHLLNFCGVRTTSSYIHMHNIYIYIYIYTCTTHICLELHSSPNGVCFAIGGGGGFTKHKRNPCCRLEQTRNYEGSKIFCYQLWLKKTHLSVVPPRIDPLQNRSSDQNGNPRPEVNMSAVCACAVWSKYTVRGPLRTREDEQQFPATSFPSS